MSDSTPAPAVPAAVVSSVHQAIRRGSVLKATSGPAVSDAALKQALKETAEAAKAGATADACVKELHQKRGSIMLKPAPRPAGAEASRGEDAIKQAYLAEQEAEADELTNNSKILHALRAQEDMPPPPPSEEDDTVPPPPSSNLPFLKELNPRRKLSLVPVSSGKLLHDGLNPTDAALAAIAKHGASKLKPVGAPKEGLSDEFKESYAQQEAELSKALRRNSILMSSFQNAQPPPAYPESADDLAEAAEALRKEQEALVKLPSIEENAATPAPASTLAHVRRNSKMAYLGDLSKPLVRLGLTPVVPEQDDSDDEDRDPTMNAFCRRPSTAVYLVGLMSGTSLDGVDAVVAEFPPIKSSSRRRRSEECDHPRMLSHTFLPMPSELRATLLQLNTPQGHESAGGELAVAYEASNALAKLYASAVSSLLSKASLQPSQIRAVACHGQTVRHRPDRAYTVQLCNNALLAELTGIPVVADFRSRDLSAGGQGAPLVPAFHREIFSPARSRGPRGSMKGSAASAGVLILNLGGIANISWIHSDPSRAGQDSVVGFDTGPANVLLDLWVTEQRFPVPNHDGQFLQFDEGGRWSSSGQVHQALLAQMQSDSYFALAPPKSTGRDHFHLSWLRAHLKQLNKSSKDPIKAEDVAATLVELTAWSVADAIARYCTTKSTDSSSSSASSPSSKLDPLLVCGGGAFNTLLLRRLSALMPGRSVASTAARGIPPDAVESFAFAWLGWKFLHGEAGNMPEVTGAKGPRVLGAYYPA